MQTFKELVQKQEEEEEDDNPDELPPKKLKAIENTTEVREPV